MLKGGAGFCLRDAWRIDRRMPLKMGCLTILPRSAYVSLSRIAPGVVLVPTHGRSNPAGGGFDLILRPDDFRRACRSGSGLASLFPRQNQCVCDINPDFTYSNERPQAGPWRCVIWSAWATRPQDAEKGGSGFCLRDAWRIDRITPLKMDCLTIFPRSTDGSLSRIAPCAVLVPTHGRSNPATVAGRRRTQRKPVHEP